MPPTDPPPQAVSNMYYAPSDSTLVSTWDWPVETGTHVLRLICAGVIDRHPNLKIIVGHIGELPLHCLTRLKGDPEGGRGALRPPHGGRPSAT